MARTRKANWDYNKREIVSNNELDEQIARLDAYLAQMRAEKAAKEQAAQAEQAEQAENQEVEA